MEHHTRACERKFVMGCAVERMCVCAFKRPHCENTARPHTETTSDTPNKAPTTLHNRYPFSYSEHAINNIYNNDNEQRWPKPRRRQTHESVWRIVLLTSARFARIKDRNEGKYWSKLKTKMKIAGRQSSVNVSQRQQCVCPNGQQLAFNVSAVRPLRMQNLWNTIGATKYATTSTHFPHTTLHWPRPRHWRASALHRPNYFCGQRKDVDKVVVKSFDKLWSCRVESS